MYISVRSYLSIYLSHADNNNNKYLGDRCKHAVTQTPMKDHHLALI